MRRKSDQLIPIEIEILESALALRKGGTGAFHGYALADELKRRTDRRALTAHGTLYRALHRLERAGLIESFWEDPAIAENEGRPRRRLYEVTAQAHVALARAQTQTTGVGAPLKGRLAT
jgi:PadR family transcriptional regulator PadR